jgi:hypothetical protein
MPLIPINLAVEDDLSEIVLRTINAKSGREYHIGTAYGRTGFGYLRKTVAGWNAAARGIPFALLTDLDKYQCLADLINDWLKAPRHTNLLFRVAVREVEAWLLADPVNLSRYLSVPSARVPAICEQIPDPKEALVNLARRSRSGDIKSRIVPRSGSTAKQGPDYNGCLATFVQSSWNIDTACANSNSLKRTVDRIRTFHPILSASQ